MSGLLTVALDARLLTTQNTGDTSYWNGLVGGLRALPDDFRCLLFSDVNKPESQDFDERFEWRHLPSKSSRWWSLVQFPTEARRAGADVVHTQYTLSPLVKHGGVTTIHDVSFFIGPEWFKPRDRLLLQKGVTSSVRRAAKVLTVSETSKAEIEQLIPAAQGKVVVTPNALGGNITPIDRQEAIKTVQSRFGLREPYVMTLGHRWPRKNMKLAIDAMRLLPEALPHQLAVVGKKGWGDEGNHERIVETGYVTDEDLSALYCAADLYLAPSFHEGFGIPLLEAFACDCPVVCSTGGALPEVAGNAAVVVPDFEPTTWARVIQETLADSGKLAQMRQNGHQRVATYSWTETARETLAVYQEAAQ